MADDAASYHQHHTPVQPPQRILVVLIASDAPDIAPAELTRDVIELSEAAAREGFTEVFIVGGPMRYVKAIDVPENVKLVQSAAPWVFMTPAAIGGRPRPYAPPAFRSPYVELVAHLRTEPAFVRYVAMTRKVARSPYDLAGLVCTATLANREWAIAQAPYPLAMNALTAQPVVIPDIFVVNASGGGVRASVAATLAADTLTRAHFRNFIVMGIDALRAFIQCGYLFRENLASPPGWAIDVHLPWNALVISAWDITPGFVDQDHQTAFLQSEQYREVVSRVTLHVLSHLFNDVLSESIPDVAAVLAQERMGRYSDASKMVLDHLDENTITRGGNPDWADRIAAWANPDLWLDLRAAFTAAFDP